MDLVGKVMSLLLNILSRLVITFLPRSKRLLISWLQSPSAVILEHKKWSRSLFPLFPQKASRDTSSSLWTEATSLTLLLDAPGLSELQGSVCVKHSDFKHLLQEKNIKYMSCNIFYYQSNSLEWVALSFSRGSFQPRNQTRVSYIADRFFTSWATREAYNF